MNTEDFDATMSEGDGQSLDNVIEKASMQCAARLLADPEWTTPRIYHICTLVNAIAYGIISSDPWYVGYTLPPNFTEVVNKMIVLLQSDPPGEVHFECITVSLIDMRTWLKKHLMKESCYTAWNDAAGSGFVSRNTPVAIERQFIDLDCPPHNAVIYMRDDTRKSDAFDKKFEERK